MNRRDQVGQEGRRLGPGDEPLRADADTTAVATVEPSALFIEPKNSNGLKCSPSEQQISCHDLKKALRDEMAAEDYHRKRSAIHELRAGVLFHLLRVGMGLGYAGFWDECGREFRIARSTVSKKMRLAVTWAKEAGVSDEHVMALAQAADLGDTSNPAVQLAFDFIGDQTTTDLYRKYKLVNYGPKGGAVTPRGADGNLVRAPKRTAAEIAEADFKESANAWLVKALEVGRDGISREHAGAHLWDLAADDELEELRGAFSDIKDGIVASLARRKVARRHK